MSAARAGTGGGATAPTRACYVHGTVPAGTRTPDGVRGVTDPPARVDVVDRGRVAEPLPTAAAPPCGAARPSSGAGRGACGRPVLRARAAGHPWRGGPARYPEV
ncbi:hypothetical protein [Streptomyces sp. NRRL B-24484]|uniref:hypothetical protein n=1 Tax=Streptomyces sp. NRRL B-24484 TaxID=1463833 RepID=UPI0004C03454|nr:hypothetical protein [Streptomyces sp. NRRL B-24484]